MRLSIWSKNAMCMAWRTSPVQDFSSCDGSLKLGFEITDPLEPQPIFRFLQELGNVDDSEMYKTFNMGMGFVVVVQKRMLRRPARSWGLARRKSDRL